MAPNTPVDGFLPVDQLFRPVAGHCDSEPALPDLAIPAVPAVGDVERVQYLDGIELFDQRTEVWCTFNSSRPL
jgi:hypothetical protein